MAAELAVSFILKSDSVIKSFCGTNPVRVYLNKRPQKIALPSIVVRRYGTSPNSTKDGASELDNTRVQVLIYVGDLTDATYQLEQRVRQVLDRAQVSGIVNNVNLESCEFEDDDQFTEEIENKEVNVFEHIYSTLIKR